MRKFLLGLLLFSFISIIIAPQTEALRYPGGYSLIEVPVGDADPFGVTRASSSTNQSGPPRARLMIFGPYPILVLQMILGFELKWNENKNRETTSSQESTRTETIQRSISGN